MRPQNLWVHASSSACRSDPLDQQPLHASAVAIDGNAVLITGQAGSGKSALALELMALGAQLVADDAVVVASDGDVVWLSAPAGLSGRIEARGIGIIRAKAVSRAALHLVVDLDRAPVGRLPRPLDTQILGKSFPLLAGQETPGLAPAILAILKGGLERHT